MKTQLESGKSTATRGTTLLCAAALLVDLTYEIRGYDFLVLIGSYNLHAADIAAGICLLAAFSSAVNLGRLTVVRVCVLAICAVAILSLLRGVQESSFHAFYAFRTRAVALGCLAYVGLRGKRIGSIWQYEPILLGGAGIAVLLFLFRAALGPTLLMAHDSPTYLGIGLLQFRDLQFETVLVMGLVMIMYLDRWLVIKYPKKRVQDLLVALVLLSVILLSRQRTATIASLVGVAALFLTDMHFLRRNAHIMIAIVYAIVTILIAWMSGSIPVLVKMLPETFQYAINNVSTLDARQEVWSAALGLLYAKWDITRQLLGAPAGEQLYIFIAGNGYWQHSLHSQYIQTLMDYGLLGCLFWAALVVYTVVCAFRELGTGRLNRMGLSPRLVLAWIAALLTYGYSYEWVEGSGFFVAMALAGWPMHKQISKVAWQRSAIRRTKPTLKMRYLRSERIGRSNAKS